MRTILAGIKALRRTPLAGVPFVVEGVVAGSLVASGALPASGGSAPSTAAFPLDIYFDVREAMTHGRNWIWFLAVVATSILFRSLVLGSTLWLADGARAPLALAWARAARLTAIATVALLPSATVYFTGSAVRYAPFIWLAAILGLVPALVMARKAVRLDTGAEPPTGKGVPELFGFLSYAYLIALIGYALTVLGRDNSVLAGLLLICLGPVHAAVFMGWRSHVREETFPGGGFLSASATVAVAGLLVVTAGYDRFVRDPPPVSRASSEGSLLLLGGVDSTSDSGALTGLDPREVGFRDESTRIVSYRADEKYSKEDTRGDLALVAGQVEPQVALAERPVYLLGHSQASLIIDRLLAQGRVPPDRIVTLASSPPVPPPFDIPGPDVSGEGKPGADLARGFAKLIDLAGFEPFDIDAEASPMRVGRVVVTEGPPRISVWALGDSVWLYDDWRRPGEINVVAISDHVGVTNNGRAIDVARRFFDNKRVRGDSSSWRGGLASLLSHAFAPWRPD